MGAAKSKTGLNEPLTKEELEKREAIDRRIENRNKNKPHELKPKNGNKSNEYRIKKARKPRKTYTYDKHGKPDEEPSKITNAKETAPKPGPNNLIFFWDHSTDSFKFSQTLRKLRNQRPLTKSLLLKHVQEDELIKLAFMLKKSTHYFPIEPSTKWFIKFPWMLFLFYLCCCVLWYTVVMAEDGDEKQKKDTIAQHLDDLIVIGVCLFLLAVMLVCVKDFKWVGRLEKREKEFTKHLTIYNRGGYSGKYFEFDLGDEEIRVKESDDQKKEGSDRHWIGKAGRYGSYILFELAPQYRTSETGSNKQTDVLSDGNHIPKMKKKVMDEEALDSIAVSGGELPQNVSVRRKDTKSMLIMGSKAPRDDVSGLEESGFSQDTSSRMFGIYDTEIIQEES